MRRLGLVAVGLVLLSVSSLAGEFLINEADAYGVRVTFTQPVAITHFGDVFRTFSPEGESEEFVFSGAKLPAWVGHWMLWTPASARIESYQWLSSPPTAPVPEDTPAPEDSADPGTVPDTPPAAGEDSGPLPLPIPLPTVDEPDTPAGPPTMTPDWSGVAYIQSYAQGQDILERVLLNGNEIAINQAQHWGLSGSEIKGVKLVYVDEGLFIQLETWAATIQGSYAYGIGFRPLSSNYVPFVIGIDPSDSNLWATTEDGSDLSAYVYLISLEDDRLVLFMEDVLLPGGASVSSTGRLWDRVITCYYGVGRNEAYELSDRVDFE